MESEKRFVTIPLTCNLVIDADNLGEDCCGYNVYLLHNEKRYEMTTIDEKGEETYDMSNIVAEYSFAIMERMKPEQTNDENPA